MDFSINSPVPQSPDSVINEFFWSQDNSVPHGLPVIEQPGYNNSVKQEPFYMNFPLCGNLLNNEQLISS